MLQLEGKNVLLGVTGGIAAYKSAELCRALGKYGANVRVVMTPSATQFVGALTFQALSGNPVHTELLDSDAEAGMGHIELAKWPDLIVIAPASADFIARYAAGFANDLLSTLLLASISPVLLAPAMNQAMWLNPVTQRNVAQLVALFPGLKLVGPQNGAQACGDIGPGRMSEPTEILRSVTDLLCPVVSEFGGLLDGRTIVISAGPTREALDPVRYLSNHSSGKMGFALAEACQAQGANVVLVSGPVGLTTPNGVVRREVVSADEMLAMVLSEVSDCDIFISAAAVADYRPLAVSDQKLKKKGDAINIELCKNPDIVATVAALGERPFTVGFAAETNDVLAYAKGKLMNKKLDMIVANDVSNPAVGFNSDDNEVYVITSDDCVKIEQQNKKRVAENIVSLLAKKYTTQQ